VRDEHDIPQDEKRAGVLRAHRREGAVEVSGAASLQRLKLQSERPRGTLRRLERKGVAWSGGVPENRRSGSLRDALLEQRELLSGDLRAEVRSDRRTDRNGLGERKTIEPSHVVPDNQPLFILGNTLELSYFTVRNG